MRAVVERLAGGGDDRVQLGERDQLDLGKAPVPRPQHHFAQRVDRLLELPVGGVGESQVAPRLRLVGLSSATLRKSGSASRACPACTRRWPSTRRMCRLSRSISARLDSTRNARSVRPFSKKTSAASRKNAVLFT